MKTKCDRCGKEFELNLNTVWATHGRYYEDGYMAVITCPHCQKRHEY